MNAKFTNITYDLHHLLDSSGAHNIKKLKLLSALLLPDVQSVSFVMSLIEASVTGYTDGRRLPIG
jgi:hypothetical protein